MAQIAWTPPDSQLGVGTILFKEPPTKPLTSLWYQGLLRARIQRMVDALDPEQAEMLLAQVEDRELLTVGPLKTAGLVLVEDSELLNEKAQPPLTPIPAKQILQEAQDPAILADDSLEEYLSRILA